MMLDLVKILCCSITSRAGHVSLPVPLIMAEGTEAGRVEFCLWAEQKYTSKDKQINIIFNEAIFIYS